MVRFSLSLFGLSTLFVLGAHAQSAFPGTCITGSDFPASHLRAEGLTESIGNITLYCSGATPSFTFTGNYTVSLPLPVTNQIDANGFTSQAVLSIDNGGGFTPSGVSGLVSGQSISFNSVHATPSASGTYNIQISNIRVPANQLGAGTQQVAVDVTAPQRLTNSHLVAGTTTPGLYVSLAANGISCAGSPLPDTLSMTNLFAAGTALTSTRVTEGFASAFTVKGTGETNGTRFVVTYSGFPAAAHVYLPRLVAGSDAATPSLGGDLGGTATVGQYLPGSGTLLLGLVTGADANGLGGTPVAAPTGGAPVALDAVTEVSLTGGAGYAVYEVLDANPNVQENAQFPTFVGLADTGQTAIATESISLGPISTVAIASATDPNPRFALTTPTFDCSIVGDCKALYYPELKVPVSGGAIQLTALAGGAMTSQPGYVPVQNVGGGTMVWNATVNYQNGSGWLVLQLQSNPVNNGSIRVVAQAQNLVAGTYQANIVIDAGLEAGSATVPVTLTVQPTPDHPAPTVTISKVVSTATLAAAPLVAGSVATLQGSGFRGQTVSVTVGGQPAALIYSDDSLIIFVVPAGVSSQTSADVVVSVDGVDSFPMRAVVAPAYPVIFAHAVRNQDWTENTASSPAPRGSVLQIFGTGIPGAATVVAQIGSAMNLVPLYAGEAPGIPGLQQINVAVPGGLAPGATQLILCASVNSQPYCSDTYALSIN